MAIVLNDGDLLEGDATTAAKVTYVVSGLDGTTLTQLAAGQLPNAKGTLYTAAGVDTIASITLFNTNTSAEAVNLYVHDGTASRQVVGIDSLGVGYHAQFDGNKLQVEDENGVIVTISTHAASHQNAGTDEISVTGLSGLLADDQHVLDAEVVAVAIAKATMDADTVLTATTDDTPVATTMAEQTVLGRLTGGHPDDVAIGIADNNIIQIDGADVADNEYARFTAAGLESCTASEVFSDLLDQTLVENDAIKLDTALSADGTYSGIIEAGIAGYGTTVFGDLVYFQTADSKWELASADNAATGCNFKLGIMLNAVVENVGCFILLFGKVRADAAFPALTIGAPVFMSTTAGDAQVAAPSGATDIIRIIGYGNTANELYFCPSNDWYEHS